MANASRPFGAKDTGSFDHYFGRSRLLLTLMYVVILAFLLFVSASTTKSLFSHRLDRRYVAYTEGRFEQAYYLPSPPKAEDVRKDLNRTLLHVNSVLLVMGGVLSYWLAGLTLAPIQVAYHRQKQFLSDASHELRTPLAILRADLENQHSVSSTAEQKLSLQSNLEEVDRMSRLVQDLLTLSRLSDKERKKITPEIVDVTTVVTKTVERLQPMAQQQRVQLVLTSLLEPVPVAAESGDLLLQAVTNVIANALAYNKEQGHVAVTVTKLDDTVSIIIKDTGMGIAPVDLAQVFNRFYRAEKSRSRATGGSGLGLSIVQSIMQNMNGDVVIESEVQKGTTVTLSMPIHKAS